VSVTLCPSIWSVLGGTPSPETSPWPMWPYLIVSAVLAALVIWKHRGNIQRMLEGRELRLGAPKPSSAPPEPSR
jgi:glycerol-3-phosphate acyltransferase PlsY